MQDLRVTLVQLDTAWHDPVRNRQNLDLIFSKPIEHTDLVVLPEMFSTGFTMASSEMAETMQGPTHQWMISIARENKVAICGSLIICEEGTYYNRFLWVMPNGDTITYDKRHLFRMADEHDYFSPGKTQPTINYLGWKIKPQVCYDLRFPVWIRNSLNNDDYDYDILIYVANWPEARVGAWDALLRARAIENHCYSIGVNRSGTDQNNIEYNGRSAVYDYKGNCTILMTGDNEVKMVTINKDQLLRYRKQFPAQLDADRFTIR